MNEKTKAIVTLIVAVLTVINVALQAFGFIPLPITEDMIYAAVSSILAIIACVYAWWKNNNITDAAQKAQEVLNNLKADAKKKDGGE